MCVVMLVKEKKESFFDFLESMNTLSPERSLRSILYTVMRKALKAERQVGQMEGVRLIKGHWLVKSTVPVEFITLPSVPDSEGNSATSRYPYPKASMENCQ